MGDGDAYCVVLSLLRVGLYCLLYARLMFVLLLIVLGCCLFVGLCLCCCWIDVAVYLCLIVLCSLLASCVACGCGFGFLRFAFGL